MSNTANRGQVLPSCQRVDERAATSRPKAPGFKKAAEMAEEKEESGDDGVVDADFEVVDSEEEED